MAQSAKTKTTIEMAREVIGNRTLAQNILLNQEMYENAEERANFDV